VKLLAATREFQDRTHKRYADTGLVLDAVLEDGFASSSPMRLGAWLQCHRASGTRGVLGDPPILPTPRLDSPIAPGSSRLRVGAVNAERLRCDLRGTAVAA
jgi:hypothetical protein